MRLRLPCHATREERLCELPGDSLIPSPKGTITHGITIDAPPEVIWPWLIQMGSGRAGWYSIDHIDNGGVPSEQRIVPELQQVMAGDVMPWLPGACDGFVVWDVQPNRALVLVAPLAKFEGGEMTDKLPPPLRMTWSLVLRPLDNHRIRLLSRSRASANWLASTTGDRPDGRSKFAIEYVYDVLQRLPWPVLLPVAGTGHYVMECRMLLGIKQRAERELAEQSATSSHTQAVGNSHSQAIACHRSRLSRPPQVWRVALRSRLERSAIHAPAANPGKADTFLTHC